MAETFRTLEEWIRYLGWSQRELSEQAGVDVHTAGRAVNGDSISPRSAGKIAAAITSAAGVTVRAGDIRGLVIARYK